MNVTPFNVHHMFTGQKRLASNMDTQTHSLKSKLKSRLYKTLSRTQTDKPQGHTEETRAFEFRPEIVVKTDSLQCVCHKSFTSQEEMHQVY